MNDNKLIAEFMGYRMFGTKCRKPNLSYNLTDDLAPMQFHTSWDWLMPVIEKCLVGEAEQNEEISTTTIKNIYEGICNQDISHAYKSVVEFINTTNK